MRLSALPDTKTSPPIWKQRRHSSCSNPGGSPQVVNLATFSFLHTDAPLVLDLTRARELHTRRSKISPMARVYYRSCVRIS